jgi:hypothetical protein
MLYIVSLLMQNSDIVAANPSKAVGLDYQFATSMSNSTLHGHLQKYHNHKYTRLKQERGWCSQLPCMQAIQAIYTG